MNDSLRSAICSLDDAATSLQDADPGINSAARRAKSLIINLSNSLRYGSDYTGLMMASAVLVESAVRIEERKAADAANAATALSMSADIKAANSGRTQIVRDLAPRIGSGELV